MFIAELERSAIIMKLYLLALTLLTLAAHATASPVIDKPGRFNSAEKKSELVIVAKDSEIIYTFTYKDPTGGSVGSRGVIRTKEKWAFMLQGERSLWIYKDRDTVLRTDIEEGSTGTSFSVGDTILRLDTDSEYIPKEILEFIKRK